MEADAGLPLSTRLAFGGGVLLASPLLGVVVPLALAGVLTLGAAKGLGARCSPVEPMEEALLLLHGRPADAPPTEPGTGRPHAGAEEAEGSEPWCADAELPRELASTSASGAQAWMAHQLNALQWHKAVVRFRVETH